MPEINAPTAETIEEMYTFICNYLYSEHNDCPAWREACPYSSDELRDKAREILKKLENAPH